MMTMIVEVVEDADKHKLKGHMQNGNFMVQGVLICIL